MQCMRLGACSATALLLAVLFSPMLQSSLAASPPLELAKWNKAYKLTVNNINSIELATYNLIEPGCSKDFDSNAARVPLGSCFYRQNTGGTYSKWNKLAGDWRVNSNCYCYALNVYKGMRTVVVVQRALTAKLPMRLHREPDDATCKCAAAMKR